MVQHNSWWSCGEGWWEFGSSETTALFVGGLCFIFAVAQVSVAQQIFSKSDAKLDLVIKKNLLKGDSKLGTSLLQCIIIDFIYLIIQDL